MRSKLKVKESSASWPATPSSSVPTSALHTTTGAPVLRLPERYFSRKFRTPEGSPNCAQALTPANAWAAIAAEEFVRWCTRCNRFRAGAACARRAPLPS
jgi:hypothetical protein